MKKPVISWWKSTDPCLKLELLKSKCTDITIIETKRLSKEFCDFVLQNKHRIYLHVVINGMGKTPLEPNIPSVGETFYALKGLIDSGFPQKQILVVINPILPNDNGLKALKLLLRAFTEFNALRLRFVRFRVFTYTQLDNGKYIPGNKNIADRPSTKGIMPFLTRTQTFWKDYYRLLKDYECIISIDKGEEAIIGIRELMAFGLRNEWINEDGTKEKLINYEKGNKFKPIVNIISPKFPARCANRCLLCPNRY